MSINYWKDGGVSVLSRIVFTKSRLKYLRYRNKVCKLCGVVLEAGVPVFRYKKYVGTYYVCSSCEDRRRL